MLTVDPSKETAVAPRPVTVAADRYFVNCNSWAKRDVIRRS